MLCGLQGEVRPVQAEVGAVVRVAGLQGRAPLQVEQVVLALAALVEGQLKRIAHRLDAGDLRAPPAGATDDAAWDAHAQTQLGAARTAIEAARAAVTALQRKRGGPSEDARHGFIRLEVQDQGEGMAWPEEGDNGKLGVGLLSVRERIHQLSGSLEIFSDKGKGTSVIAIIPDPSSGLAS